MTRFDMDGARRAILRYQPASHWVSVSRDPTDRMTVGFGFDVSRSQAAEMMIKVGLDPAAVRSGRTPVSDPQMNELFDLTLREAVEAAHRRVPGFGRMPPAQQCALLELMIWLGPDGTQAAFSEIEQLGLPLTHQPLEPSRWFDLPPETASPPVRGTVRQAARRARNRLRLRKRRHPCYRTTFESFGLLAEVASDDLDLLHAAHGMLPPGWRAADGRPRVHFGLWTHGLITVDGVPVDRGPHRDASLLKLGAVIRHHLATHSSGFTFVHAGVVDVGGCGVVIPGRSYTGKSTLVAELVRLGATYVSDEYAVLDPDGVVQPFAKPLSIRSGRDDPLGRLVEVPDALVVARPLRAGLIVLTSYVPGAEWRPSVGSRAEGALALLQNTVSARLRPGSAMSATSRLARAAVFLAGQRGEARDTAPALLNAALRHTGTWTTVRA